MNAWTARAMAMAVVATVSLATASSAMAGTIRYDIEPSDQYTVTDNDTGIAKVEWNGCLVVGQNAVIRFTVHVNSTQGGQASWRIIKEDEPIVNGTFDPNPITLERGRDQSIPTTLTFSVSAESGSAVDFRAKLDAESGEGLGEGPGIMVRVPCVVPSSPPPPPQSAAAQGPAPCIPTPTRLRLRAKERGTVRVVVRQDDQTIEGALVRLTGPGFRTQKRTGARGRVEFTVRPRRKGTLVIQTNVCEGSKRFGVLGARAFGGRIAPRFTG